MVIVSPMMASVTFWAMACDDHVVPTEFRMISLGFGKYARADRIFALEPLLGEERGDGRRTKVWVEGIAAPVIASRTEGTILRDMGQEAAAGTPRARNRPPAVLIAGPASST